MWRECMLRLLYKWRKKNQKRVNDMWHVFFLTRLCCPCDVPVVVSEEEMGTPSLQYDRQVLERKNPNTKQSQRRACLIYSMSKITAVGLVLVVMIMSFSTVTRTDLWQTLAACLELLLYFFLSCRLCWQYQAHTGFGKQNSRAFQDLFKDLKNKTKIFKYYKGNSCTCTAIIGLTGFSSAC